MSDVMSIKKKWYVYMFMTNLCKIKSITQLQF